ncbi:hypothetical protein D9M72_287830 [compost metagenome]
MSTVSLARTGRSRSTEKFMPRTFPLVAKWLAVSPISSEVVWVALAIKPPKRVPCANAASWCSGFSSPAASAKARTCASSKVWGREKR